MKNRIIKACLSMLMCLTVLSGMTSSAFATSTSSSKAYSGYGTLVGSNTFEKTAGYPLSKRVDLTVKIGKSVNYIGVKLSVKKYSDGTNYKSINPQPGSGTSYHMDFDFLNSEEPEIFQNKCAAFGTHEFRHTTSGVVYTKTTC